MNGCGGSVLESVTCVLWVLTSEGVAATMELLLGRGRGATSGSGTRSGLSSRICLSRWR